MPGKKEPLRALVKERIASRIDAASSMFAICATEIERAVAPHAEVRVQEYTIGAIITAVAALEGMVNEFFENADDPLSQVGYVRNDISEDTLERWAKEWRSGRLDKIDLIEKLQTALDLANLPRLSESDGAVQDAKSLIMLRNALVHSRPIYRLHGPRRKGNERDSLESALANKFEDCTLVDQRAPFLWSRCLGSGCARWAVEAEIGLKNELFQALGVPITSEPPWSKNTLLKNKPLG